MHRLIGMRGTLYVANGAYFWELLPSREGSNPPVSVAVGAQAWWRAESAATPRATSHTLSALSVDALTRPEPPIQRT